VRVIVHDLGEPYQELLEKKADRVILADGRYAPCQGCFGCWTKYPAECVLKDKLRYACRITGVADEFVVITRNLYGGYSTEIKTVLDRSIGGSTPLSVYRHGEMHHALRYGMKELRKVIVYGDITEKEKATFTHMAERNAINDGYKHYEIVFLSDLSELEGAL